MYVGFERIALGAVVQTATAFTVPAATVRVQLQADTANVRYTMDDTTDPAAGSGMLLTDGLAPEWFELEDLLRIRMISVAAASGLNVHYYAPGPLSL